MERITRKMIENQLQLFCTHSGIPHGHYKKVKPGTGTMGMEKDFSIILGGLAIDQLGGLGHPHVYQIHQIDDKGGTGVHTPFGSYRLTNREMFFMLYGLNHLYFNGILEKAKK